MLKLILCTMLIFMFTGCSTVIIKFDSETKIELEEIKEVAEYKKMTAEEAKEIIDSDEYVIILDVRTEEEFKEGHIPAAINIEDSILKDEANSKLPDKDATILVYCRSGRRSEASAKELIDLGYINIIDIGGIIDWQYETEK